MVCNNRAEGCRACNHTGEFEIDVCPWTFASEGGGIDALQLAEWAERGTFPAAGGVLDQAAAFMDMLAFIRSEKAKYPALQSSGK